MNKVEVITTPLQKDKIECNHYETGLIPDVKQEEMCVVNLYPNKKYQVFDGFGGALTESAGYTLSRMSKDKQEEVLNAYYGDNGIGYIYGRLHLDSCDFSLGNYCAVKDSKEPEFGDFSLKRDAEYVQPLIKKVLEITSEKIQLILSPWSPPGFMKTTDTRNGGGRLKKECYQSYADYIAKYINEYKKIGIPIHMMTVQNEPLAAQTWDSCQYTAQEEKEFLRDYLYPTLQSKGLEDVELYIWDHNKERVYERACEIIDESTKDMIAGIAFHWYSGDHFEGLQMTSEDFPQLKLMHSEGCVELARYEGEAGNDDSHGVKYAHDIIGNLNNGMNSWIDWNLVLDEKGGPNHVHNYCGAPIICNTQTNQVEYKPMFQVIQHFSRYIKPNAVRIGISRYTADLEITAFENPDKSLAVVILNTTDSSKPIQLRVEGKVARLYVSPNSISTLIIT